MMKRKLYLRVTNDKYELPMVVADSGKELAEILGVDRKSIFASIAHQKHGRTKTGIYKAVEVDDDD